MGNDGGSINMYRSHLLVEQKTITLSGRYKLMQSYLHTLYVYLCFNLHIKPQKFTLNNYCISCILGYRDSGT